MKLFKTSVAGTALALWSAASSADLGHTVPDGVSQHNHMHLPGEMIISPSWLVGAGLIVAFVVWLIVKKVRASGNKK